MTPEFAARLNEKLEAFRCFAEGKAFSSCRLVHYVGVDKPNAADVPLGGVAKQIAGCLAEGLFVDWFSAHSMLYLCVQESDCPIPPWDKVIAEEGLIDVDALLKDAGFTGDA